MKASGTTRAGDDKLVERARRGDRDAYGILVERYSAMVTKTLYYRVGDRDQADDLAQEVFVRAYRGLASFKGEASFRTWLYRIVHNVTASHFAYHAARKRRGTVTSLDGGGAELVPGPAPEPADRAMNRELREAIAAAIQALPPDMRELIVLRDMDGRSYEEICSIVETPLGTVKSRIHRGRLLLREKLARYIR